MNVAVHWLSVVVDTTDARRSAEFYRRLLDLRYRVGDEPPPVGEPDPAGADWLMLEQPDGGVRIGFQQVATLARSTWPDAAVPQQLHLDFEVPVGQLADARAKASWLPGT